MTKISTPISEIVKTYFNTYDRDGRHGVHVGDALGNPTSYQVTHLSNGTTSIVHDDIDEAVRLLSRTRVNPATDISAAIEVETHAVWDARRLLAAADAGGKDDNVVRTWEISDLLKTFDDGRGRGSRNDGVLKGAEYDDFNKQYQQRNPVTYTYRDEI